MIRWVKKLSYPIQAGHYRLERHSMGLVIGIIFLRRYHRDMLER